MPWRVRPAAAWLLLVVLLSVGCRRGPAPDHARWEREIAAMESADRTNPAPRGGVVFTGSSTIRMWKTLASDFPGVPVANRGFGGCRIEDVTHFADRIVVPLAPRMVVVRAGGNDINDGKPAAAVEADFRELVRVLRSRLPSVEIVFLSQNPTVARAANQGVEREASERIRRFASATPGVRFVDIDGLTRRPDGTVDGALLAKDGLHFNAEGYKALAARVRPVVTGK